MPLFINPGTPPILASESFGFAGGAGTTAAVAGSAVFLGVWVNQALTVTAMRCLYSGAVTGNTDMGIYDATGAGAIANNLLAHTGAIAAVTGLFTQNLTSALTLAPGRYWLAFLSTTANTYEATVQGAGGITTSMKTASTALSVLPATAGSIANYNIAPALCGLLSGGWS